MRRIYLSLFLLISIAPFCQGSYSEILTKFAEQEKDPDVKSTVHEILKEFDSSRSHIPAEERKTALYEKSLRLQPLFDRISVDHGLRLQSELLIGTPEDGENRRLLYIYLSRYEPKSDELDDVARIVKILDEQEKMESDSEVNLDRLKLTPRRVYENLVVSTAIVLGFPYEMREAALRADKRGVESLKEVLTWVANHSPNAQKVGRASSALDILNQPLSRDIKRESFPATKAEQRPRKTTAASAESGTLESPVKVQWIRWAGGILLFFGLAWLVVRISVKPWENR